MTVAGGLQLVYHLTMLEIFGTPYHVLSIGTLALVALAAAPLLARAPRRSRPTP